MKFFLCLINMLLMAWSAVVNAETYPQTLGSDSRVQVFNYSPDAVYVINTQTNHANLIQLEAGEYIHDDGGLGLGQADKWNMAVKGNNIFFKPISPMPDTNMVLVTNKRTYAFLLKTSYNPHDISYIARFNYPSLSQEPEKPILPKYVVKSHTINGIDIYIDADFNKNYRYRGADSTKPSNVWDDGRFTYIKYSHADDLPVAYKVLPDGSEHLVNSHIEEDTMVLQEVGAIYRLRLGSDVGEISNGYNRRPRFNTTGTSSKTWQRVEIQE